jgi:stress response protein YsnF
MKNPMINTTELNTPDSHTHDNIVKTVDLREDTTNTLELLAERPQVQIERFVKDNIKLSKKIISQTVNVPVTLNQEVLVIEHVFSQPSTSQDNLVSVVTNNVNVPQLMVNGQAITLGDTAIEIPLLQQIAKVNIETIVAEKVQLMTQNVSHETQIPVTLRHEELVTEKVEYDEPTVLATTHISPEEVKLVSK